MMTKASYSNRKKAAPLFFGMQPLVHSVFNRPLSFIKEPYHQYYSDNPQLHRQPIPHNLVQKVILNLRL